MPTQDSLGGNCNTTIIANISPCVNAFEETVSTLKVVTVCVCVYGIVCLYECCSVSPCVHALEETVSTLKVVSDFVCVFMGWCVFTSV
jgi:hypothetical protein